MANLGAKDARLCLFYKIVHGLVAVPLPDYVQYSNRISRYCQFMTFRQVHTSRDFYKFSFFPLSIVQWNALPESIACLQSLDAFKSASCNTQGLRSLKACFYLFLAILNYFNLDHLFLFFTITLLHVSILFSSLCLSYTNRRCVNLPRMSVRAYGSVNR